MGSILWKLTKRTAKAYSADACSHMAAAISYYVLFSIIPLAIFLVAIFGLVVRDQTAQEDVSGKIIDYLNVQPGVPRIDANYDAIEQQYGAQTSDDVRRAIEHLSDNEKQEIADDVDRGRRVAIDGVMLAPDQVSVQSDNLIIDTVRGVTKASGALTIVALAGMMWSASAMFGAIRRSLNIAWRVQSPRPLVRQKLVDLGMVVAIGALLGLSIAGTAALRTLRELGNENLGPLATGTGFFWSVLPYMLPALLSFAVFLLLYRYVPDVRHNIAEIWPGALVATVLFELLKNVFALYVAKFNNYAGAYGALGGILLFMLWTYLTANILLIGAELASEYGRMRRGEIPDTGPEPSASEQVRRFLRGLVFRHPEEHRDEAPPHSAIERRKQ